MINNQKGASRTFIIIGLVVATVILFIIGFIRNSDRGVGTGIEYSPPDGPAIMNESENLYRAIGNADQFNFLRDDIAVFGRSTVDKYKLGKVVSVIFKVTSSPKSENSKVSFEGKFEESKDTIQISVTKLKNDRIYTSITNKKTGASIDNQLPSNSKRNQYIGSLPLKKEGFTIGYLADTGAFLLTLASVNVEAEKTAAINELKTALDLPDLSKERVSIIAWDNATGLPVTIPNPDVNLD